MLGVEGVMCKGPAARRNLGRRLELVYDTSLETERNAGVSLADIQTNRCWPHATQFPGSQQHPLPLKSSSVVRPSGKCG